MRKKLPPPAPTRKPIKISIEEIRARAAEYFAAHPSEAATSADASPIKKSPPKVAPKPSHLKSPEQESHSQTPDTKLSVTDLARNLESKLGGPGK